MTAPDAHYLEMSIALAANCPVSSSAFAVGAVLVGPSGAVLAKGWSRMNTPHDHAEEAALHLASQDGADLTGATIYSSLEPCGDRASRPVSCAQLIVEAGVARVVYAARETSQFVEVPRGRAVLAAAGVDVAQIEEFAERAQDAARSRQGGTPTMDPETTFGAAS